MKTNPINQVLVVTNPAILAAGGAISTLSPGQLGIFNYDTGLSIATFATLPAKFYLAVGEGTGNVLSDVRKSSGECLRKSMLNTAFSKGYKAPVDQVHTITFGAGFTALRGEDYTLRLNFYSGHILSQNGFAIPSKAFTYSPPIAGDPTAAFSTADFTTGLAAVINADPEKIIVATRSANTLVLTIKSEAKAIDLGGINPNYDFLRQITATVSLSNGFEDGGATTAITTPAVYEQGSGYDVRWEEYIAGGWNGNPGIYRDSNILGLFWGATNLKADVSKRYWQMRVNYGIPSNSGGMLNYVNENETLIVIEDILANNALAVLLNAIFAGAGTVATEVMTNPA